MNFAATDRSASVVRSGLVGTAIAYWDYRQEHFNGDCRTLKRGNGEGLDDRGEFRQKN